MTSTTTINTPGSSATTAWLVDDTGEGWGSPIAVRDVEEATRIAQAEIESWPRPESGEWSAIGRLHIYVAPDGDPEAAERADTMTVVLDPPEPECPSGEHDWAEMDLRAGNYGGVVILDQCRMCLLHREIDTRRSGPEGDPYEAVRYDRSYMLDIDARRALVRWIGYADGDGWTLGIDLANRDSRELSLREAERMYRDSDRPVVLYGDRAEVWYGSPVELERRLAEGA